MFFDLLRHLFRATIYLSSYVVFLVLVPLLAYTSFLRTQILPRLSYHLGLALVPLNPLLLSVALVTFFVYFFYYFIIDALYSLQSIYAQYIGKTVIYDSNNTASTSTPPLSSIPSLVNASRIYGNPALDVITTWNISVILSHAHNQAVQYYPAFVLSTMLAWANTNQFDIYSIVFVMIQVILLLLLPVSYACPGHLMYHLNRVAYQCALLWTAIYAIYPQQVGYVIDRLADDYLVHPHYRRII